MMTSGQFKSNGRTTSQRPRLAVADPGITPARSKANVGRLRRGSLAAELNPLRQRQIFGEVDHVGLTAHVGFPGIRARFPPAPGLFLASKGQANLSPAGADVDVGHAAV